ncbi:unnamed protein product [Acanthoscelides obtectus]|uniref:Uncharacterized protein n=1 Tax=Acanthoscelides obtectus TaxID=200917 RepID=A0A9P0MAB4_ACAOB|nr:unnamed protein product [Acanthoscelides obtectus]CAK1626535.1 hypothetical protein AOBTE_LOCUS3908 [Acanthoscelides obtectus]
MLRFLVKLWSERFFLLGVPISIKWDSFVSCLTLSFLFLPCLQETSKPSRLGSGSSYRISFCRCRDVAPHFRFLLPLS